MSPNSIPPILRPAVTAIGAFLLVTLALLAKSTDTTIAKVALIAAFFAAAGGVLTLVQYVKKKEFSWTTLFLGVLVLALAIGAALGAVKMAINSAP